MLVQEFSQAIEDFNTTMRDQICIVDAHVKRLELAQQKLLGQSDVLQELDIEELTRILDQIR